MSLENLNKASHYSKYFGKFYRRNKVGDPRYDLPGCLISKFCEAAREFASYKRELLMKLKAVTIAYLHSLSQRNALGSAHEWF